MAITSGNKLVDQVFAVAGGIVVIAGITTVLLIERIKSEVVCT